MASKADRMKLWDGVDDVHVDDKSNALEAIQIPHNKVHGGVFFHVSHIFDQVADNADVLVLVKVGANKALHAVPSIAGGGSLLSYMFEGVTTSGIGTVITPIDQNRADANSSDAAVYFTPTVSTEGTQMFSLFIPGGTGPKSSGAILRQGTEWILAKSTDYLIKGTNTSGAAKTMSIGMGYYEV